MRKSLIDCEFAGVIQACRWPGGVSASVRTWAPRWRGRTSCALVGCGCYSDGTDVGTVVHRRWTPLLCSATEAAPRRDVARPPCSRTTTLLQSSTLYTVPNVRTSTDISRRVFRVWTEPVPYASVSVDRRNVSQRLICPSIYGYGRIRNGFH